MFLFSHRFLHVQKLHHFVVSFQCFICLTVVLVAFRYCNGSSKNSFQYISLSLFKRNNFHLVPYSVESIEFVMAQFPWFSWFHCPPPRSPNILNDSIAYKLLIGHSPNNEMKIMSRYTFRKCFESITTFNVTQCVKHP